MEPPKNELHGFILLWKIPQLSAHIIHGMTRTKLVEYLTKCSYYTINGDQKHFKLFLKLWMFHVKHFLLLLLKNN